MEIKKSKKRIHVQADEVFYYLFLIILMGAKGIGWTDGQRPFTCCLLLAGFCWVVKMCLTGYRLKEWLAAAALLGISFLIWQRTGEKAAAAAVMVIVGMKGISLKRVMKVALAVWGITFFFSLSRGLLGISEGVVVVHQKLGLGPIVRYSLGYTHPNVLHVTYFVLIMLFMYVFRPSGRRLYMTAASLFAGNLYIFLYSLSYTGVVIVTAYLLMLLYFDRRKQLNFPEKGAALAFFILCVAFPIIGPFAFSGRVFRFFNNLLSTRFELVYNIFRDNQLSLFGTRVMSSGDARLSLDSSFAYMLMYYGIVAFALMLALYFYALYYCLKKNMLQETAILLGTALAGITEQFLFNLSFKNIVFFILGYVLFASSAEKEGMAEGETGRLRPGGRSISVGISASWEQMRTAMEAVWKEKKGWILFSGLVCAAVLTAGWLAFGEKPEYVLVEKWATDYRGDDEFIMSQDILSDPAPHIRVGSISEGCGGYRFEGNAVRIEWVRCIVSTMVWGFLDGMAAAAVIFFAEGRCRKQVGTKEKI